MKELTINEMEQVEGGSILNCLAVADGLALIYLTDGMATVSNSFDLMMGMNTYHCFFK
jgi:bacteriocin-like protein